MSSVTYTIFYLLLCLISSNSHLLDRPFTLSPKVELFSSRQNFCYCHCCHSHQHVFYHGKISPTFFVCETPLHLPLLFSFTHIFPTHFSTPPLCCLKPWCPLSLPAILSCPPLYTDFSSNFILAQHLPPPNLSICPLPKHTDMLVFWLPLCLPQ